MAFLSRWTTFGRAIVSFGIVPLILFCESHRVFSWVGMPRSVGITPLIAFWLKRASKRLAMPPSAAGNCRRHTAVRLRAGEAADNHTGGVAWSLARVKGKVRAIRVTAAHRAANLIPLDVQNTSSGSSRLVFTSFPTSAGRYPVKRLAFKLTAETDRLPPTCSHVTPYQRQASALNQLSFRAHVAPAVVVYTRTSASTSDADSGAGTCAAEVVELHADDPDAMSLGAHGDGGDAGGRAGGWSQGHV
eukprot:3187398-Prymnesium_polylepis.1